MVAELPLGSSTRAEILKVFDNFRGYASFRKSFDSKPGDASTLADPAVEAGDEEDKFDKIRSELGNKTSQALLDFLFDVFAGDHDEDLSKWCRYDGKGAVALLSWNTLEGDIKTTYQELTRQLGLHKSLISTSNAGAAPGQTSRSLKKDPVPRQRPGRPVRRRQGEGDEEGARGDVEERAGCAQTTR